MAETAPLHVQLIIKTEFVAPPDVPWSTDADGGQALVEFAGRACYQSYELIRHRHFSYSQLPQRYLQAAEIL